MRRIEGNIVDVLNRKIFKGEIIINNGIIEKITPKENNCEHYILSGLIDAHVHIESSMLIPAEFSKLAIQNGTVAVIADPHEIANVMGIDGIKFMLENSLQCPLKTFYAAPSCVPATDFETSGYKINSDDIETLFKKFGLKVLGEMMNYPGVIYDNKEVYKKIEIAKKYNAQIDGHIPNVSGKDLEKYISAGISTDHECSSMEEALEKIKLGMKILIREGSAAKNFNNLFPLISKFNKQVMFCTDDSHPDDILKYGHINKVLKMGIKQNIDIFDLLTAACINPVFHYNLPVGILRENDSADFIIVDNLTDFNILETNINGNIVYSNQRILYTTQKCNYINNFKAHKITEEEIKIKAIENKKIRVIEVIDKELITNSFIAAAQTCNGNIISDTNRDILKIVVVNRYEENPVPQVGFINGFGLKHGGIASSIAHDSHNIISVGVDDYSITAAINEIIENKGGLCYVHDKDCYTLSLPFAGLMTDQCGEEVAEIYQELNKVIRQNGCNLTSPFMTLSFMSLLVIPSLKIGDKGLFDVNNFEKTELIVNC